MKDVTRRHFMCGTASLALLPATSIGELGNALANASPIADHTLRSEMDRLIECFTRFRQIEHADITDRAALHDWQERYDDLVGAADRVRDVITDDTPGRDEAIAIARACVPPSCERAYAYWLPMINGMSRTYASAGQRFFDARKRQVMSYATRLYVFEDNYRDVRDSVDAVRILRETLPVTDADRQVLKRMIESLNNDDIVDVAIARNTNEPWEIANDFASWARPCGKFTCARCEEWLSMELAA